MESRPSPIRAAHSIRNSLITRLLRRDTHYPSIATVPVAIHLHDVGQPSSKACNFSCDADHLRAGDAAGVCGRMLARSRWSRIDHVGRNRRLFVRVGTRRSDRSGLQRAGVPTLSDDRAETGRAREPIVPAAAGEPAKGTGAERHDQCESSLAAVFGTGTVGARGRFHRLVPRRSASRGPS